MSTLCPNTQEGLLFSGLSDLQPPSHPPSLHSSLPPPSLHSSPLPPPPLSLYATPPPPSLPLSLCYSPSAPPPIAHKVSEMDKQREEEAKILHSIQETRALMSVGELAKGVVYSESLRTGWRPPRYIRGASESRHERVRKKMHILTDGEKVPPPIKTFRVRQTCS